MKIKAVYGLVFLMALCFCGQASAHYVWIDKTGLQSATIDGTVSVGFYLHAEEDDGIYRAKVYMGFDDFSLGGELEYQSVTINDAILPTASSLNLYTGSSDKYPNDNTASYVYIYLRNNSASYPLTAGQDYLLFTINFTYKQNDYYQREDVWLDQTDSSFRLYCDNSSSTYPEAYADNTKSVLLGNGGPNFDDGSPAPPFVQPYPAVDSTQIPVDAVFTWGSNVEVDSYEVYLWKEGEEKPETPTATGLSAKQFTPAALLDDITVYYWQVTGISGETTYESDVWTFSSYGTKHFLWMDKTGLQTVAVGDEVEVKVYLHAAVDDTLYYYYMDVGFSQFDFGGELLLKEVAYNTELSLDQMQSYYINDNRPSCSKYAEDETKNRISSIQMKSSSDDLSQPLTAGQDYLLATFRFAYLQNTCIPGEDFWFDELENGVAYATLKFASTDKADMKVKPYTDNQKTTRFGDNGPDFDDGWTSTPVLNPDPYPTRGCWRVAPNFTWTDNLDGSDSFDLYVWKADEEKPAVPWVSGLTEPRYLCDPPLEFQTEYKWSVTAHKDGASQDGPVWWFTTGMAGDLNCDMVVDLEDLYQCMRMTVYDWDDGTSFSDINADNVVGGEEAVYQIQKILNLR